MIVLRTDGRDRYEELRAAVLRAEPTAGSGLGILRRRGVAAWFRALGQEPYAGTARCDWPVLPGPHDPSPATSDITRLIAGILVAIAMEPVHA